MSGQYTADRVAAIIGVHGEPWTLRRPGTPNVDVTVKGKRSQASTAIVINAQRRTTFTVQISNAEIKAAGWPATAGGAPPRAKDQLLDSDGVGYIIQDVDSRKDSGVTCEHIMTVTG